MSYIDSKYTVQKITFTRSKSSVFDNSLIWFVNWYRRTESSNPRETHLLAHAISILNTPVIHANFVPEKRSDVRRTKKIIDFIIATILECFHSESYVPCVVPQHLQISTAAICSSIQSVSVGAAAMDY